MPYGRAVQAWAPAPGLDGRRWRKVAYGGRSGYALASLLSSQEPAARPRPTAIPVASDPPESGRSAAVAKGTWTLTAVGDIMLSREVLRKMQSYGDYRHPFLHTAGLLRSADLTVANLELPLSDNVLPAADPHTMTFVAPTKAAEGIRWAGIDGVSLANNHTTNFGTGPLLDTIQALDRYGLGHFGGGRDYESAHAAEIFEVNGIRVALLGFDAIVNWGWTNPGAPGLAAAREDAVRRAIAKARTQADVVIPFFHWGVEYTAYPSGFQTWMAHIAVDAGADLVLGAHPHWVERVETYKGKTIVYSLGNFVFDQMWSRETRQGVIATFTFQGNKVTGIKWTPTLIYDFNQPRVATGYDYSAVLERMGVTNR
ncbi:MAG: CapA family protein [Chloroflexota bacterium]|nr:CapA family protein [Chloroflexota bacterium]